MAHDGVPDNWRWESIGSLVAAKETWNPARQPRAAFRYVDISSVDNVTGRITEARQIRGQDAPSRARKVIRTADVLFGTTRPYLKNIAIVPPDLDGGICSTGFCVLRPKPDAALSSWLFYAARSSLVVDQVIPNQDKSTYPAVRDDDVLAARIPVPPLDEQRRIVARIEELTSRLDKARRHHAEIAAELESFTPALLAKAFRGEL